MRVVGDVEHDRDFAGQDLEPSREPCRVDSAPRGRRIRQPPDRIERHEGGSRVVELESPRERRRRQAVDPPLRPLPAPAVLRQHRTEVAPETQGPCADPLRRADEAGRGVAVGDDGRPAGPEDTRLLPPDRLAVGAEPADVVDVDGGDHRHVRVEQVDRVEPAPDTHLEHHGVHRARPEDLHRGKGSELEVGQGDAASGTIDPLEGGHDRSVRDRLPIDPDPFVVGHEMRRGISAGTGPRRGEEGLRERDGGALAVGARDGHDGKGRRPGAAKGLVDRAGAREAQIHLDRMNRLLPRKPLRQRVETHRSGLQAADSAILDSPDSKPRIDAIRSRRSARWTIMSTTPCSSRNSLR